MFLRTCVVLCVFAASLALSAVALPAAAGIIPHLLYGKRVAGRVLEANTGNPIPGAHVAFLWRSGIVPHRFTAHNSRDICYHAAATRTDAQGHFQIPAWREWSTYDVRPAIPTVLVYAKGYVPFQALTQRGTERGPAEHLDEKYVLPRFIGNDEERLKLLFSRVAKQSCDFGGESQKSLYPMLKAIYDEAKMIAPGDQHWLNSFATQAAYAALAFDPLGPAHDSEVQTFISEHLK